MRGSIRLAAPCRCVPVNSDVRRHRAVKSDLEPVSEPRTVASRLEIFAHSETSLVERQALPEQQKCSEPAPRVLRGRELPSVWPRGSSGAVGSLASQIAFKMARVSNRGQSKTVNHRRFDLRWSLGAVGGVASQTTAQKRTAGSGMATSGRCAPNARRCFLPKHRAGILALMLPKRPTPNRSFDADAQRRAFASLRSSPPVAGQLRRYTGAEGRAPLRPACRNGALRRPLVVEPWSVWSCAHRGPRSTRCSYSSRSESPAVKARRGNAAPHAGSGAPGNRHGREQCGRTNPVDSGSVNPCAAVSGAPCTEGRRPPYNRSFDTDTHRQGAASRVADPASRGALPLRAGQLRR